MGNGLPCEVVGIGSVKLQMFDGVVRTVTNVRHIPGMMKNIISLGMLEANGHQYNCVGGVLQVLTGNKVVMKAKRHKNLYIMEGRVVCDEANVTLSHVERAQLWHFRLGHMSEKGLAILHKKNCYLICNHANWIFVSIVCLGSNTGNPLELVLTPARRYLSTYIVTVWGPSPTPSHSGSYTMSRSLTTTQGLCGSIFYTISLMFLPLLRSGKPKLRIRLVKR